MRYFFIFFVFVNIGCSLIVDEAKEGWDEHDSGIFDEYTTFNSTSIDISSLRIDTEKGDDEVADSGEGSTDSIDVDTSSSETDSSSEETDSGDSNTSQTDNLTDTETEDTETEDTETEDTETEDTETEEVGMECDSELPCCSNGYISEFGTVCKAFYGRIRCYDEGSLGGLLVSSPDLYQCDGLSAYCQPEPSQDHSRQFAFSSCDFNERCINESDGAGAFCEEDTDVDTDLETDTETVCDPSFPCCNFDGSFTKEGTICGTTYVSLNCQSEGVPNSKILATKAVSTCDGVSPLCDYTDYELVGEVVEWAQCKSGKKCQNTYDATGFLVTNASCVL